MTAGKLVPEMKQLRKDGVSKRAIAKQLADFGYAQLHGAVKDFPMDREKDLCPAITVLRGGSRERK